MTIYHVDNAGADGNGSEGSPWNNIAGHVAVLAPNDLMYIHGDVGSHRIYTEAPIVLNNSGSATYPITIRPYPGQLITLKTTPVAWNTTITLNGNYWILDLLWFDKDFAGGSQILIHNCSHSIIRACNLTQNGGDAALFFASGSGAYSGTDVLIDNCTIYDTFKSNTEDSHGILIAGTRSDITIQDCTLYNCRGDCITPFAGCGEDILIKDCHIYTTDPLCCENGIDFKGSTAAKVTGCKIHGFRYCTSTCGGSGGGIGAGIIAHDDIVSLTIEDCEIYNCASGISIWSNTGICRIGKNLIRDLVTDNNTWLNAGIYCHSNSATIQIYKNTFYELPQHLYRFDATADVDIQNNIHCETHTIQVLAGATVAYNNNGWFNSVDTLSGANDVTGNDPGFRDAINDNYHPSGVICMIM